MDSGAVRQRWPVRKFVRDGLNRDRFAHELETERLFKEIKYLSIKQLRRYIKARQDGLKISRCIGGISLSPSVLPATFTGKLYIPRSPKW